MDALQMLVTGFRHMFWLGGEAPTELAQGAFPSDVERDKRSMNGFLTSHPAQRSVPLRCLRNVCCLTISCAMPFLSCAAGEVPAKPADKLSLNEAHKGTPEIDTRLMDSYGRPPEERRAFYLAAREIFANSPAASPTNALIVEAARKAGLSLMSGPMLGDVSESGVTVWFRPVNVEKLIVQVRSPEKNISKQCSVEGTKPGAATQVRLDGLSPGTRFCYQIRNQAGSILGEGSFLTLPKAETGAIIRIAFGSCLHKIGFHNPNLMQLMAKRGAQAVLLLGDLAADDRESKINMHYSDYFLRDVSSAWRAFSASIPNFASWDDHDYLNDDKSGLQKDQISNAERNALRKLWQENWVNPPVPVEDRGIYFNAVLGDVEIIMLDTRSCRDWSKRGQRGSYLGDAQMEWLHKTLKASKAGFIILSSGTMWSDFVTEGKDSWGTWDIAGREEIFDFIEKNKIGGVVFISGDRHGARGFKIKRASGFTLHEFEAATLGGVPGPAAYAPDRSAQIFGYAGGLIAFGELTFDMGKPDPEATFRLINEEGKTLEESTFYRSQIASD